MPITGFDHVNIRAPNLRHSIQFLTEVLGMVAAPVPGRDSTDKAAWIQDANGTTIMHMAAADVSYSVGERLPDVPLRGSGAIHHIALSCTDYAAMRSRLQDCGVAFRENSPAPHVRQLFVKDPSDITFELNFFEP